MNSRQRFLETMQFGAPDSPPLFEEGFRDEVFDAWRLQGLSSGDDLPRMFHYDLREEIMPDLDSGLDIVRLSQERSGLEKLRKRLNPDDPRRLPENWKKRLRQWKTRSYPLLLQVHRGFFLTLGIEDWRSFAKALLLPVDQPEFVHQVMTIQGEFAARITEKNH